MKSLAQQIANRYFFGKKSTNVINLITSISVLGIAVGACALILVMSVFNGFHDLLYSLFNTFNPPIKVEIKEGKVFSLPPETLASIEAIDGVIAVSQTLQETAMFEYEEQRDIGTIKGVDDQFLKVSDLDSAIVAGVFMLSNGQYNFTTVGAGLESALGVDISNEFEPLKIHMPKRKRRANAALDKSFTTAITYPKAIFSFQHDFDKQYIISSIEVVRDLLNYSDEISALEIRTDPSLESEVQASLQEILGPEYSVKNRYQQEEAFLKLMNMEKWMAFLILSLTLLLVAFNLIGALWMIVLEKKKDISILKAMGATDELIRNVFLREGLLITLFGLAIGTAIAVFIYWLQTSFSIVPMRDGFIVNSYPISMRWFDLITIIIVVSLIGLLASILPAMRAKNIGTYFREE